MSNFVSVQHTDQSSTAAKATAETAHATERRTPNVSIKTGAKAVITVRNGEASLQQPKIAQHNVADNEPSGSSPASSSSGTSSDQVVVAKSLMGRQLTGADIREDSVVNIGGIETTVAAAKAIGKIRVNSNGILVYADAGLAPKEATNAAPKGQPKVQQQEQPTPAEVEMLDPASETVMQEIVSSVPKLGNMTVHAAQKHLIEEGSLPLDLLNRVSTAMGQEPTAVAAKFEQVRQAFTKQAHDAVGHGAEAVFDYARQHAPQELRAAIDQQVKHGSTKGYQRIAQNYFERLDQINPNEILQSQAGQQLGARRENDGTITIEHPKYGRVQWRVAVRKGLFKVAFNA
jgi:hypothetical protein